MMTRPDKPIVTDVVCIYCGHPWSVELPADERDDREYIKCPNCGKDGGKRTD